LVGANDTNTEVETGRDGENSDVDSVIPFVKGLNFIPTLVLELVN
jgi:hypothetical protein